MTFRMTALAGLGVLGLSASCVLAAEDDPFRKALEQGNAQRPPPAKKTPARARALKNKAAPVKEACEVSFARRQQALSQIDKFYLQKCFYDERCTQAERCSWYRQEYDAHFVLRGLLSKCDKVPNRDRLYTQFSAILQDEPYFKKCTSP